MAQVNSALVRAIWIFTLCLLVFAILFGTGNRVFSLEGILGLTVFSLATGWLVRRRPEREEELSAGTAYPTRKVRREREPDEGKKYRREPKLASDDAPAVALAPTLPQPTLAAPEPATETRAPAPVSAAAPPPGRREPGVAVRREFWVRARQRLEASEPIDLGQGNIMELEQGRRVDRPVLAPAEFEDAGAKILVPPKMGVPRFDACFDLAGMRDYPETRDWTTIPELVDAERVQHLRNRSEAIEKLEAVREKFQDFDRIYLWMARVLRGQGQSDDATQVLLQGLAEARTKAQILTALGIYAVEDGRLADAIRWLVRAVALQMGGGNRTAALAFRYLASLSSPHPRLNDAVDWLREEAGRIDGGGGDLMRTDADYCARLSETNSQPWMIDVVDALHGFYGGTADAVPEKDPARV